MYFIHLCYDIDIYYYKFCFDHFILFFSVVVVFVDQGKHSNKIHFTFWRWLKLIVSYLTKTLFEKNSEWFYRLQLFSLPCMHFNSKYNENCSTQKIHANQVDLGHQVFEWHWNFIDFSLQKLQRKSKIKTNQFIWFFYLSMAA